MVIFLSEYACILFLLKVSLGPEDFSVDMEHLASYMLLMPSDLAAPLAARLFCRILRTFGSMSLDVLYDYKFLSTSSANDFLVPIYKTVVGIAIP